MDFVVNRERLEQTATVPAAPLTLGEGDILVRIEQFAFTANNVSYAATGDALGYWKFFPTSTTDSNSNGRVPVWGVGTIVASRCSGLSSSSSQTSRKVYGYFPMSHYVMLHPAAITTSSFVDGMPHRRSLPAVYNQYLLCDEDPFYAPRTERAMMVLRPLFFTSWLLLDFFSNQDFFGATACILSSASSKTSIGLAFLLQQYNQRQKDKTSKKIQIIGLTSPRNQAFVQALGVYDQIILYDTLEQDLTKNQPSCFVDMAGNTQLTTRLHQHLRDNMKYSCLVGAAHVGQGGKPTQKLPGARPKFFFAPSWTARRIQELDASKRRGMEILLHHVLLDYQRFVQWCLVEPQPWLKVKLYCGPTQVKEGYQACLQGNIPPDTAVIMSLWEEAAAAEQKQNPTAANTRSKL
ncbi:Protein of unknown function (DUF2855) [Seminavis robusta]|uniref:DUF2855 family protein n=1 Tax=Seminavis robusta TaxID=568900 RepID=A0A9N8H2T4_9STRA|nr:Protein of unknown function (DUF2855) [Seminavis robusta]|eukprot:Sro72_g040010.1 Protein of unknown function (DUF2855) (407) ;mRNA; f:96165-97385